MGFKENLRRLRNDAALSQAAMAKRVGVPFRTYQNWEAGVREPRLPALVALASALGVTVDELAAGTGPAPKKKAGRNKGGKK